MIWITFLFSISNSFRYFHTISIILTLSILSISLSLLFDSSLCVPTCPRTNIRWREWNDIAWICDINVYRSLNISDWKNRRVTRPLNQRKVKVNYLKRKKKKIEIHKKKQNKTEKIVRRKNKNTTVSHCVLRYY